MKTKILLLAILTLANGCTLIPTDGWPRPVFAFSREAIEYRKEKRNEAHEQDERATNTVDKAAN